MGQLTLVLTVAFLAVFVGFLVAMFLDVVASRKSFCSRDRWFYAIGSIVGLASLWAWRVSGSATGELINLIATFLVWDVLVVAMIRYFAAQLRNIRH